MRSTLYLDSTILSQPRRLKELPPPSREYLAHRHTLENEAKAAKRGGWGVVQP